MLATTAFFEKPERGMRDDVIYFKAFGNVSVDFAKHSKFERPIATVRRWQSPMQHEKLTHLRINSFNCRNLCTVRVAQDTSRLSMPKGT
jgi:hypothetical protein